VAAERHDPAVARHDGARRHPAGSFGKVFGFVTTGFNLGGMVAPLIYAWLMDHGQPRMIYVIVVLFILLALVTA
jgi:MFS family permease